MKTETRYVAARSYDEALANFSDGHRSKADAAKLARKLNHDLRTNFKVYTIRVTLEVAEEPTGE